MDQRAQQRGNADVFERGGDGGVVGRTARRLGVTGDPVEIVDIACDSKPSDSPGREVANRRILPVDTIAEARRQWDAHGWADVSEGMAAITSIMRAQQIMLARVDEVLKPFELTFARYELLMLLLFSSRGSMPIKKASERLQVHPTSITNAVDRLESAGQRGACRTRTTAGPPCWRPPTRAASVRLRPLSS